MKKEYRVPYLNVKEVCIVYIYINNIKVNFILDLNRDQSSFNRRYIERSHRLKSEYIKKQVSCYALRTEHTFELKDLTHEEEHLEMLIYGVLGKDFFKHYVLTDHHTEEKVFCFAD